jgi:DNA-binding PadR family transcriptional regulator
MFEHNDRFCAGRDGHRHFGGGGRGSFFGGSFGGGFRGGGAGMRTAKMLASGDLQLIILLLLSEKPRHGYEIIKAVEEHSSGVYTPSPGMVYPALTYLEEMGYAEAAVEGTKKQYSITPEGGAYLSKHRVAANEVWNQLLIYGRKLAHFRKQFAEDEDVADHFGSGSGGGTGAKGDWQQMKAEFRGLRDELKTAIYEKITSSMDEKRRVMDILRRAVDEIRGK